MTTTCFGKSRKIVLFLCLPVQCGEEAIEWQLEIPRVENSWTIGTRYSVSNNHRHIGSAALPVNIHIMMPAHWKPTLQAASGSNLCRVLAKPGYYPVPIQTDCRHVDAQRQVNHVIHYLILSSLTYPSYPQLSRKQAGYTVALSKYLHKKLSVFTTSW